MKPDTGEPPSPAPLPEPYSIGRDDNGKPWRPANVVVSFAHAADGVAQTFRAERNFRFHCVAAAIVVIAGFALHLPPLRIVAVLFAVALVLVAELVNTAIEATVDLAMPEHHPLAKRAKDAAAGAVLVAAGGAILVGGIVFLPALVSLFAMAGVSSRIVVIVGTAVCAFALGGAVWLAARRKRAAVSGTSNDSFRRTVIGVGLVAYVAFTGYRMTSIVGEILNPSLCTSPLFTPARPEMLFPGGVP